jgi:hypothetical protein
MATKSLPTSQGNKHLFTSDSSRLNVQNAQDKIYNFLLKVVKEWPPEDVLQEFKRVFLDKLDSVDFKSKPGIYGCFSSKDEQEFRNTLKRCCYILINNWESVRKHKYIQDLVNLFENNKSHLHLSSSSKTANRYKIWLKNFITSKDYQEIKLFVSRQEEYSKIHWTSRYNSYLLLSQAVNQNNPKEQQEAARKFSQQLKDRFKFDLAMYIARSQSPTSNINRYRNPTVLGDNVLRLIKSIVVKKGVFSYENIANIFVNQTQAQTFEQFKISLQKYLIFSVQQQEFVETLQQQLSDKLISWKPEYHEDVINKDLLLRTCNRVVDCLTTENGKEPSPLFVLLLSQGNPLTMVIVLLKVVLICKNVRSHLELRIADLINYYNQYPENECKWVINFIEIFNITFAIYAENVEYNLISMSNEKASIYNPHLNLDDYHLFSQLKMDGER